jgi:hypothetical protein
MIRRVTILTHDGDVIDQYSPPGGPDPEASLAVRALYGLTARRAAQARAEIATDYAQLRAATELRLIEIQAEIRDAVDPTDWEGI